VEDDINRVIFAVNGVPGLTEHALQPLSVADLGRRVEVAVDKRLTAEQLSALVDDLAGFNLQ